MKTTLHPTLIRATLSVVMLAAIFVVASCAPPIPRAIIPPESEIRKLDAEPILSANEKTRAAVGDVSRRVDASRHAADRVSEEALRVKEAVTKAKTAVAEDYELSLAAVDAIVDSLLNKVKDLQSTLKLASTARDAAVEAVTLQEKANTRLVAHIAAQNAQIDNAKKTENTLRQQVEELAQESAKLAVITDKLEWWRWRFAPMAGVLLALLLMLLIVKLRFPPFP